MTEENQSDIELIESACKFLVDGGSFSTVLVLACKNSSDGREALRYKQVAGNVFAAVGMAELYLRDEYNE